MNFIFNQRNLEDLSVLDKCLVCNSFDQVKTEGGATLLKKIFRYLLADPAEIKRRKLIVSCFKKSQLRFPFNVEQIRIAENYLSSLRKDRFRLRKLISDIKDLFLCVFSDKTYGRLEPGLFALIDVLKTFREFLDILRQISPETVDHWNREYLQAQEILFSPKFNWMYSVKKK